MGTCFTETTLTSTGSFLNLHMKNEGPSMYYDRVPLAHITTNPSSGEDKQPAIFNTRACRTFINPDKTMTYRACNKCNKKVSESTRSGYWCERCQNNEPTCKLRFLIISLLSNVSGEAWFSIFNEEAETLLGCSADELAKMKAQVLFHFQTNIAPSY
ncbi:Nucleic acid-binding, OB-fold [Cynara cardunculus var. scolymus]|uniref:Nucleic acid-binding, OB-fold n=1 Tax=Cynara cardunculus var. scolymus TaxID=59895 RepID=A0A103YC51_CYNCS|nr:Nucleic acid-binding, OB-fold [Cynara cardunculus var. scolymus]